MNKLSVIVPVYNVESYLNECLESLIVQSMHDFTIICVNDGSTDSSRQLLSEWESRDARVRVIDKKNGGLSSARNAGIDAAETEYVCFLDSDDRFHRDACKRIVELMDTTAADIVTFGATCLPPEAGYPWLVDVLSPRDIVYDDFSMDILLKEKSRPFAWRTACRTEFLNSHSIRFDESVRFGEDQVFHFAVYPRSSKTTFSSEKLYDYRVAREGSLMFKMNLDAEAKLLEHVHIVDAILADWAAGRLLDQYKCGLLEWVVEFVLFDAMKLPTRQYHKVAQALRSLLNRYFTGSAIASIGLPPSVEKSLSYACYRSLLITPLRRRLARSYCSWRYGEDAAIREFGR